MERSRGSQKNHRDLGPHPTGLAVGSSRWRKLGSEERIIMRDMVITLDGKSPPRTLPDTRRVLDTV